MLLRPRILPFVPLAAAWLVACGARSTVEQQGSTGGASSSTQGTAGGGGASSTSTSGSGTACVPFGQPCTTSSACCTGFCADGICAAQAAAH